MTFSNRIRQSFSNGWQRMKNWSSQPNNNPEASNNTANTQPSRNNEQVTPPIQNQTTEKYTPKKQPYIATGIGFLLTGLIAYIAKNKAKDNNNITA